MNNIFIEYRWLKATNSITENFIEKVKNIALKKGTDVFKMSSRNSCINKHYDENTAILFVDGMGVEYIDYLSYLFSDLDEEKYSVTYEAGFCNLPSTTKNNTDFLDNKNLINPPVRELDELKHSNIVYPESIIKQLDVLEQIKNRVIGSFSSKIHRIIIVSDHGTSRMAVMVRNTEYDNVLSKPENIDIYKYGRYSNDTADEGKYPTAININNYMIFADYTRFVQNGAPIDEIHGGASLEEWIVPIITIEKYGDKVSKCITIVPKFTQYKPDPETQRITVVFTISGKQRNTVYAKIHGINYLCKHSKGCYEFDYTPSKSDQVVNVKIIDGEILGEFDIQIKTGIKNNAKFDI